MKFIAVRINADTREKGKYSDFPSEEVYKTIWGRNAQNGFHECVNFKNFGGKIEGYLPPTGRKYIPNEPFGIIFLTPKTNTPKNQANRIIGLQIQCMSLNQDVERKSKFIPKNLRLYLKKKNSSLTFNYTAPFNRCILFKNAIENASEILVPSSENNGKIWMRSAIKPISEQNLSNVLSIIEQNLAVDEKKQWMKIKASLDFTLAEFDAMFDKKVQELLNDKNADLNPKGNFHPQKSIVRTSVYIRNPEIVAAVLKRANGVCEKCKQPAPFKRKKDGSPYLEVHHIKQLKDGGADTMDNAIALCPNCHRKKHYG
ncbi:MAG: HNH endonuclease [Fibrobacter sp.]|nr:HNH endonuclease [Fibrobacter sp.]